MEQMTAGWVCLSDGLSIGTKTFAFNNEGMDLHQAVPSLFHIQLLKLPFARRLMP